MATGKKFSMHATRGLLISIVFLIAAFVFTSPSNAAGRWRRPDADRSLEVVKFTNEPLKVIDIKLGRESVIQKAQVKSRADNNEVHVISVGGQEDWVKNLRVSVRNVSDRAVTGVIAFLIFDYPGLSESQGISLSVASRRKGLREEPLAPGSEAEFEVRGDTYDVTFTALRKRVGGVTVSRAVFHIVSVSLGNDLRWKAGTFLRRDPNDPQRWTPVDGGRRGGRRRYDDAGFRRVAYYGSGKRSRPWNCYDDAGGFIQEYCAYGIFDCYYQKEIGTGSGNLSLQGVNSYCQDDGGSNCSANPVTWQILMPDERCGA